MRHSFENDKIKFGQMVQNTESDEELLSMPRGLTNNVHGISMIHLNAASI